MDINNHTNENELNVLGVAEYLLTHSVESKTPMTRERLIELYLEIIKDHERQVNEGITHSAQRLQEIESYKARVEELQQEPE